VQIPAKSQLASIAKRYGLRLIVLFGSQATGHVHPESDIDVAVWATRALTPAERDRVWRKLSELLRSEVDLTVLNHAEPLLLRQVAHTGRLLYESRRWAWEDFKGFAFRYYLDTGKFRDDLARYLDREIPGPRHAG